ncbi:hypothetical protein [uncultured Pseudomonas sp.]|uniref:hypothetical protein n=1 Tax=uncultured Pseudomonas sp. TaxID=114707 RepID=UPI0025ED4E72|nr:hypothetical protein [uncultured Pseudomonas sp.]
MYSQYLLLLVTCVTGLTALSAQAEDRACTLEGKVNALGTLVDTKDCMVVMSAELPAARLKESCTALAQLAAVGGGGPAKITYSEKCPATPQAVCKHFMGQPVDYYYYRRDAELLEKTRKGCGQTGGTWWTP